MSNSVESTAAATNPATQPAPAPQSAVAPHATAIITPDQAIEKCMTAYQCAFNATAAKGQSEWDADKAGRRAFRLAMPSVGGLSEIQAFIACVIHGMHREIWVGGQDKDLFYAAQVAISAHRGQATKKREIEK